MYSKVDCSSLTSFYNLLFQLLLYFGNNLLNTCRVNTSICNKLMQCKTTCFTTYWVKSRNHNSFRCVIYNNFHTTCSLESSDVTSFTSDDTSFYLVVIYMEDRNRVLNGSFSGDALYCFDDNLLCLVISINLSLVHYLIDVALGICACLIFETFNKTVSCLICRKS